MYCVAYRGLDEEVAVVVERLEAQRLQLLRHERGRAVEEALEFLHELVAGNQLALVALVEDVLNFRKPPGNTQRRRVKSCYRLIMFREVKVSEVLTS